MTAGNATRENDRAPLVIGAIAALLAAVGLVFVVSMTVGAEPAVDVRTKAREGDLSVWVEQFEWIAHDHGAAEGDDVDPQVAAIQDVTAQAQVFPMPSNMMTGTPDVGFARMQIELNVLNRGAGVAAVVPTDFHLESAEGVQWQPLIGGTFSGVDLGPSLAVSTVVAFDVPERFSGEDMFLVWSWGGGRSRFALGEHGHG